MTTPPIARTASRTASWILTVVLIGVIIPAGGFLVAAASRTARFRSGAPRLGLLLTVAALVLVVQVAGVLAMSGTSLDAGPIETVNGES